MTEAVVLTLLWAYTIRAAWTGGTIRGWYASENIPLHPASFWLQVALWPLVIWRGIQAQRKRK